jgi:potassium-dependent mechanosensitive channel
MNKFRLHKKYNVRNFVFIKMRMIKWLLLIFILQFNLAIAKTNPNLSIQASDSITNNLEIKYFINNPSGWIQNSINKLNAITLPFHSQIDTIEIKKELAHISLSGKIIRKNLQDNLGSYRLRYMREYANELQAHIDEVIVLQNKIQKYNNYLVNKTIIVNQIQNELNYFKSKSDSSIKVIYKSEIESLMTTLDSTNAYFSSRLTKLVKLEIQINKVVYELQENSRYVKNLIITTGEQNFKANLAPIWKSKPSDYPAPFLETAKKTFEQGTISINFIFKHGIANQIVIRLIFFIIFLLPLYFFHQGEKISFRTQDKNNYLEKYPFKATIVLFLTSVPLLFVHAPFIFTDMIFVVTTLVVSSIFLKEYSYISKNSFNIIIYTYILLKFINMLMTPTFVGRLIFVAAILILIPIFKIHREYIAHLKQRSKVARLAFIYLLIQLFVGWILLLTGHYPIGRTYFISALDAFLFALILIVSVNAAIDYLRLLTILINKRLKLIQIDKAIVEKYLGNLIVFLALGIFCYAYLTNMNLYDILSESIITWINAPRYLGSSEFTYLSIILFIVYITGAILLADFLNKVIDTKDGKKYIKQRTALGSIMLLIRFALITIGFIIGIIASGIPMTQFTVLMGALGVGIGFGLQNIFNNMVSGLIIAVEKPISVGDMIEVGNDIGWVKGIGIRSSNIQTFNGAEVIVPNGELISNRVINWTLSDKHRRMDIAIGVAYKSDPHQVYSLLSLVLKNHPEVLDSPEPDIYFNSLGNSSIDFNIYFWVSDFIEGKRIRSEVLFRIFDTLKENNIEIPFPQHDLHLRSVDSEVIVKTKTV